MHTRFSLSAILVLVALVAVTGGQPREALFRSFEVFERLRQFLAPPLQVAKLFSKSIYAVD